MPRYQTVYVKAVLTNSDAIETLLESLEELESIHEDNPWHGIGEHVANMREALTKVWAVQESG